jgi:hypothetical protein
MQDKSKMAQVMKKAIEEQNKKLRGAMKRG